MSRRGFTLLEVLAAVAVLAIAYTVLAGTAMQGLANEGEAHRRLHASLLADLQLSEIEAGLAAGAPPAPVQETELEDYTLSVEVLPYDLADFAAAAQELLAEKRGAPRPTAPDGAAAGPPLQLLSAAPGAPPPLFQVVVHVRWVEGAFEREVTRTTFTADPVAVQQAVATLPGAGGENAGEGAAGEDAAPSEAPPQTGEQAPAPDEDAGLEGEE